MLHAINMVYMNIYKYTLYEFLYPLGYMCPKQNI